MEPFDSSLLTLPHISDGEDKSSPIKNRIRKNYRHFRKWAKRTHTDCFRLYDREINEYQVAIDFYAGRFAVQFFSKDRDSDDPPQPLLDEINQALITIFATSADHIYWRTRIKRGKIEQYEKRDQRQDFFTVHEYGAKFWINLVDYLDTGLFLDHRETRRYVASLAKGKRVLNLFAYTCSFSIHAALAGANMTKSVDLSNTYTEWGRENFLLNGLSLENNEIVRADCLRFLDEVDERSPRFDLIILDPPTISRSKKMDQLFDIQVDHPYLIERCLLLLAPGGILIFSTNSRRFKLDPILQEQALFQEVSEKTIPFDFHNKKIHRCWKVSYRVD